MGLLNKIFGNRDDPETAAGEGPDESSPDRETIELEPYEPSGGEPAAAPEQSGRVTFAPPASGASASENRASTGGRVAGGRRKRRRAPEAEFGSEEQPHELTRRRIARPTVSTEDPPIPPPIPVDAPEADDPEEIDVSDQLDEVNDAEADLDASSDLIIEDDEPGGDDEDDDETSTSVAVWRDPAAGPAPPSSPAAASTPVAGAIPASADAIQAKAHDAVAHEAAAHEAAAHEAVPHDESGSISADTTQPDPEWTRMATVTKIPKQTLVEAGTEFKGTLKSSCPVVVNGTLEGEIDAPTLSITSTGSIHGNIRVQTLRSSGTLAGNVDAGEVYVSGAVRSKTVIRARRLELALGSSGKGQVEVTLKSSEQSDLPNTPEASTARSVAPAGESEAPGGGAWDLPEGDDSVEPARARASGKRTTAK